MFRKEWIMTQEWHDVLFLHWPVSPDDLREHIPPELELDLYNGRAWIGLVSFEVKENRPRFFPPTLGFKSYLQLNVRTYVKYKGRVGVHFFNLLVNNSLIVKLTKLGNFLPYRYAEISMMWRKNTCTFHSTSKDRKNVSETLVTTFQPIPSPTKTNQFDQWLTERYHLWTKTKDHLFRIDISHSPWILKNVTAMINENTMASFIKNDFRVNQPIAHYSKMKKAKMFLPVKEDSGEAEV
ncbi:DUF2071 domain-containing protein [Psychrobacillus sp. FSL H8-0483]|uniref:YqjF family protein n=1 Tax=Psychrobacillus sp. FSL H8-0483 TaxID=2921389 RepID=UPI00315A3FEA